VQERDILSGWLYIFVSGDIAAAQPDLLRKKMRALVVVSRDSIVAFAAMKPSSIVGITKKDQAIGVDRPVKREIKFKERHVPQEEKR
jgi:hypothetical protein